MEKIIRQKPDDLVTVKEVANILHISPKTIYNKLSSGEFPLNPIRLPWNRRDIFFIRKEVDALADARICPTLGGLRRLLRFIPEPAEPILVAAYGVSVPLPKPLSSTSVSFREIDRYTLREWRNRFDVLWLGGGGAKFCLSDSSADLYAAAAFVCRLIAEGLREDHG